MKNIEAEIKSQKRECDVLRGKRLKKLRSMTTLSIEEFAKQLGVTRVSVSYWENASQRTLSEGRARKIITFILEKHNIECSVNWLWEGKGPEPRYVREASNHPFSDIEKEIEFFKEMHHEAVFVKVDSDKLWPYFMFNDVIAGLWRSLDVLQGEEFCIVPINNRHEIRWVKKVDSDSKKAQISFSPLDKEAPTEEILLEKIAPIMRVWRIKNS